MDRSLTVLLPVRDAQATLARDVADLLDVVPDLTRQFELMIIDDGSVDATFEVAQDLTRRYPQVRLCRHGRPRGQQAAIQTGLQRSTGEVVVLRNDAMHLGHASLGMLWRRALALAAGGAMAPAAAAKNRATANHTSPAEEAASPGGVRWIAHGAPAANDGSRTATEPRGGRPGRPSYLRRLRDFALGE